MCNLENRNGAFFCLIFGVNNRVALGSNDKKLGRKIRNMVALGSDSKGTVRCFAFRVGSLKLESDRFK